MYTIGSAPSPAGGRQLSRSSLARMSIFSRLIRSRSNPPLPRLREDQLILFPQIDNKETYLDAFWRWVALLEKDDYQQALEALHWPKGTSWTASALKERVTTFFGGSEPWSVVIPNDRLLGVIADAADFKPRDNDGFGWFMAQIPLTTRPSNPKDDEIPLMGLACSFFVRPKGEDYVMEFEIFHV